MTTEQLVIHRELEYLRAAARACPKRPPRRRPSRRRSRAELNRRRGHAAERWRKLRWAERAAPLTR